MSRKQVLVGFTTEGTTDVRFLEPVIQRTFEEVAFECSGEVDILPVQHIPVRKEKFEEEVFRAAQEADNQGLMVLCVHTDADDASDNQVFEYKIKPAFEKVMNSTATLCKILVAIVPVRMTEAWLLADKEKFKEEIGTSKSDNELGINRAPETIAQPKEVITEAIRIVLADWPRRRRSSLKIAELYLPLGKKVRLEKLARLSSYQKFKEGVRESFKKMNYLPLN